MQETLENLDTGSVDTKAKYRVGTLEYTKRTLFMLFAWLLWGDLCFTIMENVFPQITPITMRNLGSSNFLIGLVVTTIPNVFAIVICPWVSFKSDRYRSKLGRRKPFILFSTPLISMFLILIGLSPDIGRLLGHTLLRSTGFAPAAIILALIGIFSVGFQFFNMFVSSVYYYLFNDVVPDQFLSRFMGLFRLVGTLGGATFMYFIFPYAETHMKWIFIGGGILYFVAFTAMSLKVKEGEYPPPPEYVDGKQGFVAGLKTYFVECFSHPFYRVFFLATACWDLSYCINPFNVFLQQKALGLSLLQVGKMMGTSGIVASLLIYPAAVLSDKKHPLRALIGTTIALLVVVPLRLIYLFCHFAPPTAFKVEFALQMLLMPLTCLYLAANLPMFMRILPSERYGQFCAAQAMVRSALVIICGVLAGGFMDLMKKACMSHGLPEFYYYKFVPVWSWAFLAISLVLMLKVYRYWKKYGGDEGYQAPAVGRASTEELEVSSAIVS